MAANSRDKNKARSFPFASLSHTRNGTDKIGENRRYYYCCSSVYCYSLSFELRYNQLYLLRYNINLSNSGTQPVHRLDGQGQVERHEYFSQACQTNEGHIKEPMEHWTNSLVSTKYISIMQSMKQSFNCLNYKSLELTLIKTLPYNDK